MALEYDFSAENFAQVNTALLPESCISSIYIPTQFSEILAAQGLSSLVDESTICKSLLVCLPLGDEGSGSVFTPIEGRRSINDKIFEDLVEVKFPKSPRSNFYSRTTGKGVLPSGDLNHELSSENMNIEDLVPFFSIGLFGAQCAVYEVGASDALLSYGFPSSIPYAVVFLDANEIKKFIMESSWMDIKIPYVKECNGLSSIGEVLLSSVDQIIYKNNESLAYMFRLESGMFRQEDAWSSRNILYESIKDEKSRSNLKLELLQSQRILAMRMWSDNRIDKSIKDQFPVNFSIDDILTMQGVSRYARLLAYESASQDIAINQLYSDASLDSFIGKDIVTQYDYLAFLNTLYSPKDTGFSLNATDYEEGRNKSYIENSFSKQSRMIQHLIVRLCILKELDFVDINNIYEENKKNFLELLK